LVVRGHLHVGHLHGFGGAIQDWTDPDKLTPTRLTPNAADVLIFWTARTTPFTNSHELPTKPMPRLIPGRMLATWNANTSGATLTL